jgi:ribosomal protein S1
MNENTATPIVTNATTTNNNESGKQPPAQGSVVTGRILRPAPADKNFVLVKLEGGFTGLLHESQVSGNSREARSTRLHGFKSNETVTVAVEKVGNSEGKLRIQLSERAIERQARDSFASSLTPGQTVTGTVCGFLPSKDNKEERIGAFLELEQGVRGLVHVSELDGNSREEREAALAAMQTGETLTVAVIKVEPGERGFRIALSQRRQSAKQYLAQLEQGEVLKGRVFKADGDQYLLDLGNGLVGALPAGAVRGTLNRGASVRVKVESVSEDGTVHLARA